MRKLENIYFNIYKSCIKLLIKLENINNKKNY